MRRVELLLQGRNGLLKHTVVNRRSQMFRLAGALAKAKISNKIMLMCRRKGNQGYCLGKGRPDPDKWF
jgi:hypothetical protein